MSPSSTLICWDLKCRSSCSLFSLPYSPFLFASVWPFIHSDDSGSSSGGSGEKRILASSPIFPSSRSMIFHPTDDHSGGGKSGFIIIYTPPLGLAGRSLELITVSKTPSNIMVSYMYCIPGSVVRKTSCLRFVSGKGEWNGRLQWCITVGVTDKRHKLYVWGP